jgi:hypothetical protein
MKSLIKKTIITIASLMDILLVIVTTASAIWLKSIRKVGVHRMKVSKWLFTKIGVFPIRNHYYEPLFNTSHLTKSLRDDRTLPGIDFNLQEQLTILSQFDFSDELKQFPLKQERNREFY